MRNRRLKFGKRHKLLVLVLGLAVLFAGIPAFLVLVSSPPVRGEHLPEWQFLLAKEVYAQANGDNNLPGTIVGTAMLKSRDQHHNITVNLDGGPVAVTDTSGHYEFDNVSSGVHVLNFSFPGFLRVGIVVAVDGGLTTFVPDVELIGGDVLADGVINADDLARIARQITFPQATRFSGDINGDGKTNIIDLLLALHSFNSTDIIPSGTQFNLENVMANFRMGSKGTVEESIDAGMSMLYGSLRPVISAGAIRSQTEEADQAFSFMEERFVDSLLTYTQRADADPVLAARAFDLAMFVHQMNSVSQEVSIATGECALGDMVAHPSDPRSASYKSKCGQLLPLLNDPVRNDNPFLTQTPDIGIFAEPFALYPSYSVALRADIVPPRWSREIPELVKVTPVISSGGCESIFKETRGLMLRLHLDRFTVVREPWISVFDVPQGTEVPIWSLEWQPAEYVRAWEACNDGGELNVSVENHVNREEPLNYFWRFYSNGTSGE